MLYPAHWLIIGFVAFALLFWVALLVWAARTGLFRRSSEAVKYKVFETGPETGKREEHD